MNTLYTIISLFALGALIGMYLISMVLQNKQTSKTAAFVHGVFVAVAQVMLIIYSMKNGPGLTESIVLFAMAALGGFVLIYRDLTGKKIPKWLAVGHGLLAIAGFIFLLLFAFSR